MTVAEQFVSKVEQEARSNKIRVYAPMILLVFIRYMRYSVKANGWSWYHILAILLFIASLIGIGFFGEYRVQRTAQYVRCYIWQGSSLFLLAATVLGIYATCVARDYDYDEEE